MRPLLANLALAAATTLTATSFVVFHPRAAVAADCVFPGCQEVTVNSAVAGGPPIGTKLKIKLAPLVESKEQEDARKAALPLDSAKKKKLQDAWDQRMKTEIMPWWGNEAYAKEVSAGIEDFVFLVGFYNDGGAVYLTDWLNMDGKIDWSLGVRVCKKGWCGRMDSSLNDNNGHEKPPDQADINHRDVKELSPTQIEGSKSSPQWSSQNWATIAH